MNILLLGWETSLGTAFLAKAIADHRSLDDAAGRPDAAGAD
jgi:hypothetical protein